MLDKVNQDLKTSMLARDKLRTQVLKSLKTELMNAEIASKGELSQDDAIKVLKKCAKQRQEASEAFQNAGDQGLATKESAEKKIIQDYLPSQASEADIQSAIDEVVSANPDANQGQLTGQVMSRFKGQADGSLVAKLIAQTLNQ